MNEKKMLNIVQALTKNTKEKRVKWNETSNDSTFSISMKTSSASITKIVDSFSGDHFVLSIFNSEGTLIEEISDKDLAVALVSSRELLKDLHELARQQALNVEDTLDDFLDELEGPH